MTESFFEDPKDWQELLCRVFLDRADLAERYHSLLANQGIDWGLLGSREANRLWSRHILNSAIIESLIPAEASVIDVGSGAGLPGLPLAIARKDIKVTLVDSLLRRVTFLEMVVHELGLEEQVEVVRSRAEELTSCEDIVVARAVAPLDKLAPLCEPLMNEMILALKGENAEAELAQAQPILKTLNLSASIIKLSIASGCPPATVVRITRQTG